VAVNPQLSASPSQAGDCVEACFTTTLTGTGYHPNSSIDVLLEYVTPDEGAFVGQGIRTSDDAGSWSLGLGETCEFDDGTYTGLVTWNLTATDAEGASASTPFNGACP